MKVPYPFPHTLLRSPADFDRYRMDNADDLARRRFFERSLMTGGQPFTVEGFCAVCCRSASFDVDYRYSYEVDGVCTPNWREGLTCPGCGLNNRMRATIHLVTAVLRPAPTAHIYLTERLTPVYEWIARNFSNTIGSEFLGDAVPKGSHRADGVRNEDLAELSFDSEVFDIVVSLDVIEHIPRFERAFSEISRVLKPGGTLLFSVPFRTDLENNLVRARVTEDGEIEHLLPPEYHGDPLSEDGCLAFYHFGWELLEQVRRAGFSESYGLIFWSNELGYLGSEAPIFLAKK